MQLSVKLSKDTERALISVAGEVDVSNADELRAPLDTALDSSAASIEIDIAQVSYIDSTGIGVLVGAARRAAEQGREFALLHPQANVERVLTLLGVIEELHVRRSE